MKWILFISFLALNLLAEANLTDLPVDVQNEIKSTEEPKTEPSAETIVQTKAAEVVAVDKNTKEEEIPLSIETTKKVAVGESTYFRIILVVALIGILASGMWILIRKNRFQNIKKNKNEIKILAQHYLGPKKSLAVVRVAGESILVGITDAQINMIKTLSLMDDELPDVTSDNFKSELDERMSGQSNNMESFTVSPAPSSTYNRKSQIGSKSTNNKTANNKTTNNDEEMDEFSIKGIKDLVSTKLKNMRSI